MYISTVGLFISSQYKSGVEVSELPAGRARPSHMYFVAQSQSCVVAAGWNQFARHHYGSLAGWLAWSELEPELNAPSSSDLQRSQSQYDFISTSTILK